MYEVHFASTWLSSENTSSKYHTQPIALFIGFIRGVRWNVPELKLNQSHIIGFSYKIYANSVKDLHKIPEKRLSSVMQRINYWKRCTKLMKPIQIERLSNEFELLSEEVELPSNEIERLSSEIELPSDKIEAIGGNTWSINGNKCS